MILNRPGIILIGLILIINHYLQAQEFCPVPLYSDPVYKGSADPEVIWNEVEQEWWIFYTARRSVCEGCPLPALAIGVASSKDWVNWKHEGYIKLDGIGGTADGPDILWAPGITRDGDTYHMILTYKKGSGGGSRWGISESMLLHLTAPKEDLLNGWITKGVLNVPFSSIDGTIVKLNDTWNIFHRDIINKPGYKHKNTFRITTNDLNLPVKKWNYLDTARGDINRFEVNKHKYQEAQYAFYWKKYFWMLTDPSNPDIPVYKSEDLESWEFMGNILNQDGENEYQKGQVRHPGVVVVDDRAFIFYFNQPFKNITDHPNREQCFIQISELMLENGTIACNRDELVKPPKNPRPSRDGDWGQIKQEKQQ